MSKKTPNDKPTRNKALLAIDAQINELVADQKAHERAIEAIENTLGRLTAIRSGIANAYGKKQRSVVKQQIDAALDDQPQSI